MSESDSPQPVGTQPVGTPHMMTVAREWLRDENARMASSGETVRVGCTAHIVGWLLAEVQRLRLRVCDRISELGDAEREAVAQSREPEAAKSGGCAMNLATAVEFQSEIARLHAEIERLRLTDAEREAVSRYEDWLAWCEEHNQIGDCGRKDRVSLRGLLERSGPSRAKKASSAARIKASPPPPADLVDALHDAVTPTSGRRLSAKPFGGKRRN